MDILAGLLVLSSTVVANSGSQQDATHQFPVRAAGTRFLPRDIAGRIDGTPVVRQVDPLSPPPTTTTPICDQFDAYFYVTPRNYTWQLQCTTNYEGTVIQQIETSGYADCIVSCADYNRANGAGACIGINFNGPDDNTVGLCTQFSSVTTVLLAYEEGNVQDSALLVFSPNGTVFATPRPGPSFSGQPSQPPTVDPVPSVTISESTTIMFTTSVITVTSCPLGVSCPLGPTSTPSTQVTAVPTSSISGTSLATSSSMPSMSSQPTISITDGGTRPGTPISSPVTSITTVPGNSVNAQVTFTTVVAYTVYQVQAVALCPPTPGPCTQTTRTAGSSTGFRTQLSCSPGICTGVGITNAIADVAAATCIDTAW